MRFSTVAACTLAAIATQSWTQQASAQSQETVVPKPDPAVEPEAAQRTPLQVSMTDQPRPIPLALPEFSPPIEVGLHLAVGAIGAESPEKPAQTAIAALPVDAGESWLEPIEAAEASPEQDLMESAEVEVAPSSSADIEASATELRESEAALNVPQAIASVAAIAVTPLPPDPNPPVLVAVEPITVSVAPVAPPVRIDGEELPVPGVLPIDFVFPIEILVETDPTISSASPITDQGFPVPNSPRVAELISFLRTPPPSILPPSPGQRANYADYSGPGLSLLREAREFIPNIPVQTAPIIREQLIATLEEIDRNRNQPPTLNSWADQIRACMEEKPSLYSVRSDGTLAPVLFSGRPGRIVQNDAGQMVCPQS